MGRMPWESLIQGVIQSFLGTPHIARHTKCSTNEPCALRRACNETNSLVEIDVQDDDFELGLAKKDLLLNQEEGKNPEKGSGPENVSVKEGQGLDQTGGSTAKPCLKESA